MSVVADIIAPRHGSYVNVQSLRATAPMVTGGCIGSAYFYSGGISDTDIDLKSTITQYAVTGLEDVSSAALTDVYCNITTSIAYPFVFIGLSGLVEANGDVYSSAAFAPAAGGNATIVTAFAAPMCPDKAPVYSIPILDTSATTGRMSIATDGTITVGPFGASAPAFFDSFACMYQLTTIIPV